MAVRNPGKAGDLAARGVEVRHGDYDEPATQRQAFDGADRLLFISSPTDDSHDRVPQHRNVVAAARDAGVGTLAYTSGLGADVIDEGLLGDHHATERAILDRRPPPHDLAGTRSTPTCSSTPACARRSRRAS